MKAGYREIGHGADAALEVWATDLPGLFRQSALGMYSLLGAEPDRQEPTSRKFHLSASDDEALLVSFLSQLLYLLEQDHLMFPAIEVEYEPGFLTVTLEGVPPCSIQREIKAVTFNDLAIQRGDRFYRVMLVFDL